MYQVCECIICKADTFETCNPMSLEQQVTNLELSKKLKELGVKQKSLWYWANCCQDDWAIESTFWHDRYTGEWTNYHELEKQETYSAFTVAELGEMLPEDSINLFGRTISDGWFFTMDVEDDAVLYTDTEANARAKALAWLIENKHIEV